MDAKEIKPKAVLKTAVKKRACPHEYSKEIRAKAIELHKAGKKPKEIVAELSKSMNPFPKVKGIRRWIHSYKIQGKI